MRREVEICEFCQQRPPEPWIYCQNESCIRQSLGRLVTETRAARRRRENEQLKRRKTQKYARLKTQKQASCPLCKELIAERVSSSCLNCKTTYHNDCLLEMTNSQCSTVGCNKYIATVAAP